jgi:acid stress-induced BolA-like protein IbaG/YrbA|tara:strand:+ start:55 stop:303 length:249 start_codon:yes stop_codon:yes gene_type:complete
MVSPQDIKGWIEENLPGATVEISGDGHHFEAEIVCNDFAGKSRIQQHQMVYGALGDRMKAEIHALSMRTLTPEEKISLSSSS